MARDKLITIRIEGEKREAFNNLTKSQNTDTASLLYDFISGCLDSRIDIKLVTGKGNRLDKIDNQLDTNRLDKLEATTQRLDHWIGALSERLNDWILRSDRRVNDCEKELSEKITNLEHRLSTLSIQLDSQQIDSIDTDSQLDSPPDMEPLLKREIATSPLPTSPLSPGTDAIKTVVTVESVEPISLIDEPGTDAIETVPGETDLSIETVASAIEDPEKKIMEPVGGSDSLDTLPVPPITDKTIDQNAIETVPGEGDSVEPVTGEGMTAVDAAKYLKDKKVKVSDDSLYRWIRQETIPDSRTGKDVRKHLTLTNQLYYPIN